MDSVVYLIIFFILGTILGSFYTVIGLRLPKGEGIFNIKSRSHCDMCKHPLSYKDLIPIFSFVFQKGKCRYCHEKIPYINIIVELATGILFAIAFYSFGFTLQLLIAIGIISLFMIVIVSDLTYLIIPDEVVIFFAIYFIILQFFIGGMENAFYSILSGVLLFAIMYGLMLLGNKLFKKESLGGGDVKLMFLVGLVLGPILGVFSIFLSSLLALPVSIFLFLRKKENVIPFGPFILLAFVLLYLMKIDLSVLETFL